MKPFFSQTLSLHSHLFLALTDLLKLDHLVFGSYWRWYCWWMRQTKPVHSWLLDTL